MEFAPQNKPFLVMKKKTQRMLGNEAQRFNILTICVIAELIRTTLGPLGYDKLIIDPVNEIIITNHGGTIMKNFEVRHPAARLMDKLVRHMEDEVGDTTKTAMIYAGELLKKSQIQLMDEGVHQNIIINGYEKAGEKVLDFIKDLAVEEEISEDLLKKIVRTALNQRFDESLTKKIVNIVINAINYIKEEHDGKVKVSLKDNLHILAIRGKGDYDIELIKGMALDMKEDYPDQVKHVKNARIACIEPSIEFKKFKFSDMKKQSIKLNNIAELEKLEEEQLNYIKAKIQVMLDAGANVILTRRDLHYKLDPFLKKAGVLAAKWVKGWELEKVAKATGARLIKNLEYITPETLGKAELVEEIKIGNKNVIMIKGCENPKAVTILIRGSSDHVIYEAERRINNALHNVKNMLEDPTYIHGGGSVDIETSLKINEYSREFSGKEQLAIQTFAKCMEIIPYTLAESSGNNPSDVMTQLKTVHSSGAGINFGVDLHSKKPRDMKAAGIIEPLKNKMEALQAAVELVCMILKIDDIIYTRPAEHEPTLEEEEAWEEFAKEMQ